MSLIPLHEKFLQFDWLRAIVFQLNMKYLHVKITNLVKFYFYMCTQKNLDEVKISRSSLYALYERKHVMVSVKIDQWGRKSLGGHGN